MAGKQHRYRVDLKWTGNRGAGTTGYTAYERSHELRAGSKPVLPGSSDPGFRGDASRWNPEELLVASLCACHQLWYLHLCAVNAIVVTAYEDAAEGVMIEEADGGGHFASVTLRPRVTITAGSDLDKAQSLHHEAAEKCFIARSVNFPVGHEPTVVVA
jgi:organic hydroperoxide reductase OsmC/OhrA